MLRTEFPRITATVYLQAWTGWKRDNLETLSEVAFDATAAVMSMTMEEVAGMEDGQFATDGIVRQSECPAFAAHGGPFDVCVVDAIDEFLERMGVPDGRDGLTHVNWARLQEVYRLLTAYAKPSQSIQSR